MSDFYYAMLFLFKMLNLNVYVAGWLTFLSFVLGLLILVRKLVFK